jgi:hypothetical protein
MNKNHCWHNEVVHRGFISRFPKDRPAGKEKSHFGNGVDDIGGGFCA